MSEKTLDFLVTAVDNFGDTGFALDLAESVLLARSEWEIRFFSDNRELFDKLSDGKAHARVRYFDLSEYESLEPSERIVSFFDRKLPEGHFAKFPRTKKILQLSYLRFDADAPEKPGVGSMNGTRYRIGGDEVVHLVPSPLAEGAGVVVGDRDALEFSLRKRDWEMRFSKNAVVRPNVSTSVFCYPETLPKIKLIETVSHISAVIMGKDLDFLRFDEYAGILGHFRSNVVRGENSAVKAMIAGQPFLWDFYKERNGAHEEKIGDFLAFMSGFFEKTADFEAYARATRAFNSENFDSLCARDCAAILEASSKSLSDAFASVAAFVKSRGLTANVLREIE